MNIREMNSQNELNRESRNKLKTKKDFLKNSNSLNTRNKDIGEKVKKQNLDLKSTKKIKESLNRFSMFSLDKEFLNEPHKVALYCQTIFDYFKKNEVI
jgi:hypothetical protein